MIHSSVYKGVRERLVANSVILKELPFALVDPDGESLAQCLADVDAQSAPRVAAE